MFPAVWRHFSFHPFSLFTFTRKIFVFFICLYWTYFLYFDWLTAKIKNIENFGIFVNLSENIFKNLINPTMVLNLLSWILVPKPLHAYFNKNHCDNAILWHFLITHVSLISLTRFSYVIKTSFSTTFFFFGPPPYFKKIFLPSFGSSSI